MSRHYCDPANPCPGCLAAIDEAEMERDLGDPIGPDEWDALEAGPWWNSYPGMGAA